MEYAWITPTILTKYTPLWCKICPVFASTEGLTWERIITKKSFSLCIKVLLYNCLSPINQGITNTHYNCTCSLLFLC